MTCLVRTRGSSLEMARLFDAEADGGLEWPVSIWPGDKVPVVEADGDRRRLRTRRWGLDADAFERTVPAKSRGLLYPRDLLPRSTRLHGVSDFERCLIVIEAFAYPRGPKGQAERIWVGFDDAPLLAWAGLCRDDRCAGLLRRAPDALQALTATVPLLVTREDCGRWRAGAPLL